MVVDIPRPARAVIGTGVIPAGIRRLLAGSARPVVHRIAWMTRPAGPESGHGDDSDDPDRNPHDEKGTHDGYDRVVHDYARPRGRLGRRHFSPR